MSKERSPIVQSDAACKILKLITEDPNSRLLDLLEFICESWGEPEAADWDGPVDYVRVIRPRGGLGFHEVSYGGFLLLEWVEGAMGTTMLLVDLVHITCLGDTYRLLTALQARLLRQPDKQDKQVVTWVESEYLKVDSTEAARTMSTVMQHSQSVTLYRTEHRPQLGEWGSD